MEKPPQPEENPINNPEQEKSKEQLTGPEQTQRFTESLTNILAARGYSLESETEKEKVFVKEGQTLRMGYNFNPSGYVSGYATFENEGANPGTVTFGHQGEMNDQAIEGTFDTVAAKFEKRYEIADAFEAEARNAKPIIAAEQKERLPTKKELYRQSIEKQLEDSVMRIEAGFLEETFEDLWGIGEIAYQAYEDGLCEQVRVLMNVIEGKIGERRIANLEKLGYSITNEYTFDGAVLTEIEKDGHVIFVEKIPYGKVGLSGKKTPLISVRKGGLILFDSFSDKGTVERPEDEVLQKMHDEILEAMK